MNAQELIDTSNRLISERSVWDQTFEQIARLVLPLQDREFARGVSPGDQRAMVEGWAAGPRGFNRVNNRYDITAITALDRLVTGVLSLVTPDSEKWEQLGIADLFGGGAEASDAEQRWLETQMNYLFGVRYNPKTGWAVHNQGAVRSMAAFGTGLYFIEEAYGAGGESDAAVPYKACPLPLSENYLTVDGQSQVDQDYRRYWLTYRQAGGLWGSNLSGKALAKANDPKERENKLEILHWVGRRQDAGLRGDPMRNSVTESVYLEVETKHEIRRSGFNYWPIIVYWWNQIPNSAYGESPVMLVLAEIKSANILAKNALLSAQQLTRPPIATADDATMARPNLNPEAINYGAVDAQGRLKIQPIITAQNPSLVREIMEASRNQIQDGMYSKVWQYLIQNPQMTATEALIRANEKAETFGPIGTRIQAGLSVLTDAELTILEGKGAWAPGSALEPPASLRGKNIKPRYTSPLDRLRRSADLIGIQRALEIAVPLAQVDPDVMDNFDMDAIVRAAQEITGAPKKILRLKDEVAAMREQKQQQRAAANAIATVGAAGEAAQSAIPAAQMAGDLLGRATAPA